MLEGINFASVSELFVYNRDRRYQIKYLGSILNMSICLLNTSGDDEYKKLS